MREQGAAAAAAPGGPWAQARANLNGEQLAYVAALASGARLAFGDRPKEITYRRLFGAPTLADLDRAFEAEVARQYREMLGDGGKGDAAASSGSGSGGGGGGEDPEAAALAAAQQVLASRCLVDDIMMTEREAVMCKVAWDLAAQAAAAASAGNGNGGSGGDGAKVALVVGSAHLPGLRALWASGRWRELVAADALADSPLLRAPQLSAADLAAPGAGARRGMLDALMGLSVPGEVLADMDAALPPVPEELELERQYAWEVYSSQRAQLAALPRDLLDRVASGPARGASMWDALAPVRAVRPVNGGKGWDEDLVMALRALDLYISAGGGGDEEDEEDAMNNRAGAM